MNYHNITKEDMLNGDGIRVVLWVSGCEHKCKNCQNPITWDKNEGLPFDKEAEEELFEALSKPHITGITFSGGDPLAPYNRSEVSRLIKKCKETMPDKTVWLYTGYLWEEVKDIDGVSLVDVLADGEFVEDLKDGNIPWVGSTNQRVIDVQKTLETGSVVLLEGTTSSAPEAMPLKAASCGE